MQGVMLGFLSALILARAAQTVPSMCRRMATVVAFIFGAVVAQSHPFSDPFVDQVARMHAPLSRSVRGALTPSLANLLNSRYDLFSSLVDSGSDEDLEAAFLMSSHLGPSLRSWIAELGLDSLIEPRA